MITRRQHFLMLAEALFAIAAVGAWLVGTYCISATIGRGAS